MAAGTGPGITYSVPGEITVGKEMQRGFINDNILHSPEHGDIHYSSYIPEAYDGQYNDEMIVLSTQLNDWGETSADQAIALTEFFLAHYNIDPEKVYLHGYSGGGETGSLVMAKRPELYTAFLCCATQWDGNMTSLAEARTPVYMVTGENDSYYGSKPLKDAYEKLYDLYLTEGLTEREIDSLLILDIKEEQYFTARGFTDQHMGGQAFAKDKSIMGWLFGAH